MLSRRGWNWGANSNFLEYSIDMPTKKDLEKLEREIHFKMKERQLAAMGQEDNRAQGITIGLAGGGTTEITMRGVTGGYLWNVYQPVEVVELINQLAANIGCHIHIRPRNDFSSWRQWKEISDEEREALNGFPPFSEDYSDGFRLGTGSPVLPSQKNQPITRISYEPENKDQKDVATKKTVNKRSAKRSRTAAK